MMKSVTGGLGILTILALTGAMTPTGQAMLGLRPATQNQSNVAVINDGSPSASPAVKTATSNLVSPTPAAAVHAAPTPAPAAARVPARPHVTPPATAPVARPNPPVQVSPAQSGLGQMANIANILLNLPQVLGQTQVRPAPDETRVQPGSDNQWNQRHRPKDRERKKSTENDDIH